MRFGRVMVGCSGGLSNEDAVGVMGLSTGVIGDSEWTY